MDYDLILQCGCAVEIDIEDVGDYGYGGEFVSKYEPTQGRMTKPCNDHGGVKIHGGESR